MFEGFHLIVSSIFAGAKAFEWKQDIGINQARRTGQVANLLATSTGNLPGKSSSATCCSHKYAFDMWQHRSLFRSALGPKPLAQILPGMQRAAGRMS